MKIAIANISLDVQNFRHQKVTSEREAIELLLKDERAHKISELASDIVEMGGLDPSSFLIVTDDPEAPGRYIALEGNRRITALKALIAPSLAAGTPGYPTFKKLSTQFLALNIADVDCVVLDRHNAFNWIKRKHYKGMGGRGVLEWNAVATARSDASEGRFARWMTAIDFLENMAIPSDSLLEGIASKTTTVERVFGSPQMTAILGITFDKSGNLTPENGDNVAAASLLVAMLEKMGEQSFTETQVTNAKLQKEFIEAFVALSVKKPIIAAPSSNGIGNPDNSSSTSGANPAGAIQNSRYPQAGGKDAAGTSPTQPTKSPATTTRSKPIRDRKRLAENGLRISNAGLNKLYSELKKLSVETAPHISSAMLRVFLEKASMVFLEEMSIACQNPGGWHDSNNKLRTKVLAVLTEVDPQKKNKDLDPARDIANATSGKVHTLDYLNEAIHNHKAIPSTQEIIVAWDRMHPYYKALFNHLEINGK